MILVSSKNLKLVKLLKEQVLQDIVVRESSVVFIIDFWGLQENMVHTSLLGRIVLCIPLISLPLQCPAAFVFSGF